MSEWLATLLVVLVTAACATPAAPVLTNVTILEWTRTVDKTGEPTHWVQIEYRSRKDGAFVRERFQSGEHTRLHSNFYACIDEAQAIHELVPCDWDGWAVSDFTKVCSEPTAQVNGRGTRLSWPIDSIAYPW